MRPAPIVGVITGARLNAHPAGSWRSFRRFRHYGGSLSRVVEGRTQLSRRQSPLRSDQSGGPFPDLLGWLGYGRGYVEFAKR